LAHNSQTDSADFGYLFIGAAILLDMSSDAKVQVCATATVLWERVGREDWQQSGTTVHTTVLLSRWDGSSRFRAAVLLSATRDGNRYLDASVPLAETICHRLHEVLNSFSETFAALNRAKHLRHLLLGELEQRMPVTFAQSGRCLLPSRRNFARLA
jgi:hypothetical protein